MKDQYVYNKVVEALKKRNVDPAKNALTQVDGALQGEVTGYKRIYLDAVPHGQCVHDHAHNFNLGIGVAYKTVKFARKMLKHLQKSNVYINDSPKRLKAFHLTQRRGNLNEDAPTKVCPSRWSSECTLPNSLQFVDCALGFFRPPKCMDPPITTSRHKDGFLGELRSEISNSPGLLQTRNQL